MNVTEIMETARDALSVQRVFGEPYERNGVVVIPTATVAGGGGGGSRRRRNPRGRAARSGHRRWFRSDGQAGRRLRDLGRHRAVAAGRRRQPRHPRRAGRRRRAVARAAQRPPPPLALEPLALLLQLLQPAAGRGRVAFGFVEGGARSPSRRLRACRRLPARRRSRRRAGLTSSRRFRSAARSRGCDGHVAEVGGERIEPARCVGDALERPGADGVGELGVDERGRERALDFVPVVGHLGEQRTEPVAPLAIARRGAASRAASSRAAAIWAARMSAARSR